MIRHVVHLDLWETDGRIHNAMDTGASSSYLLLKEKNPTVQNREKQKKVEGRSADRYSKERMREEIPVCVKERIDLDLDVDD